MTSETNSSVRTRFFDTKIEFLKGVGPQKAALLNQELNIFTFGDLIQHYPFRHEDRSVFHKLSQLSEQMPAVQVKGRLRDFALIGEGSKKRLVGTFQDGTGHLELVWFQSISWYEKWLRPGGEYIVYGNPVAFGGKWSITHPEIEVLTQENASAGYWQPIYPLTEKLRKKFLDSKALSKMMRSLLEIAHTHIRETLPVPLIEKYRLISKAQALWHFHLPQDARTLHQAQRRLKFEELFYNQFRLIKNKLLHKTEYPGLVFDKTMLVKEFYEQHLPFKLTGAQIRVLHEIHEDLKTGKQMNSLLQGDVG